MQNGNIVDNQTSTGTAVTAASNFVIIAGDRGNGNSGQNFGRIITSDSPGDAASQSQSYIATLSGAGANANNLFVTADGSVSPQQLNNALQGIQGILSPDASVFITVPNQPPFTPLQFQMQVFGPGGALDGAAGTVVITNREKTVITRDGHIVGGAAPTDTTITIPITTPTAAISSGPAVSDGAPGR